MNQAKRTEIENLTKDTIVTAVEQFLKNYKKKKNKQTFQILDLLIPKERKIRSVVGGLEGSLGITLWEKLARKIILNNNKLELCNKKDYYLEMPKAKILFEIDNLIETIITKRSSREKYTKDRYLKDFKDLIKNSSLNNVSFEKLPSGYNVDIWAIKKGGIHYLFDLKTVQINAGGLQNYFRQILKYYAYFLIKFPKQNVEARLVLPYNPYVNRTNPDFWSNCIKGGIPLSKEEVWVEDDFWSFCSGEKGTYDVMREAILDISKKKKLKETFARLFS